MAAIAGARAELAEAVVAGGALPAALLHAGHDAAPVRRAAACLLRDIVKQSIDVSLRIKIISVNVPTAQTIQVLGRSMQNLEVLEDMIVILITKNQAS